MSPESENQRLSQHTQTIARGINYLMSPESGLRQSKDHGWGTVSTVYFHDRPVVIPDVVAAQGVALDASLCTYTFDGEEYVEQEVAYLEDRDTQEVIDIPLVEGKLTVDPDKVEEWDELKKQRVLVMTSRLLELYFSNDGVDPNETPEG